MRSVVRRGAAPQTERRNLAAPAGLVTLLLGFNGVEMIGRSIRIAQQNFGEHYKAVPKLVDTFSPDIP